MRTKKLFLAILIVLAILATPASRTVANVNSKFSLLDVQALSSTETPSIQTKVVGDVTFSFISVDVTSNSILVGDSLLKPSQGYSVLCVHTSYVGDMNTIFPTSRTKVSLTITDKNLVMSGLSGAQWKDSKADLCFYVVDDSGPYVLRSTSDPTWFFDLTPLMTQLQSPVVQDSDHISCDYWASCYEGETCVYNPDAVWADGITKGNYVCQDKDTYPYDLKPCPYDPTLQCAWEKP